jgi:hypothetical protein
MKHLFGFFISLVVLAIMVCFNQYVIEISEFIIGWVSCIGYFAGKDAYVEMNEPKTPKL